MLIYVLISLVTLAYLSYHYVTRSLDYWKQRNVPGPQPVPLFGNFKESTLKRKTVGTVYREIYEQYPNEKVVGIHRMVTPSLLIRDLDLIKHIMIKDFDNFIDRGTEISKKGLTHHLFNAESVSWRILRNRFTPLFTSGKLRNMFYLMNERGDHFVDYITNRIAEDPEQEVHALVQKFTVSTISACAFGIDIDIHNDKMEELKMINELFSKLTIFRELATTFPKIFRHVSHLMLPKKVVNFFYGMVRTVISQRNGKPTDRKDFMDLILEMRQEKELHGTKRDDHSDISMELTEDVIAAQAFVFYIAGYETSASTLSFLLHRLAVNPEIQDKVIAEVDGSLERHDGNLTYDAVKEMSYMSQVFDETLRMYSLVEPLQRKAGADYKLPGTDVTVKKGQVVYISTMGVHYDENIYPNPTKFDPERFSQENSKARHSCAYMPFGVGPRNCIGMRFAQYQSKVCIAKILSNFRVEPSANTQKVIKFDPHKFFTSPLGGIRLNLVARKR